MKTQKTIRNIIAATLLGVSALTSVNAQDLRARAELNEGVKEDQKYTLSVNECKQAAGKAYIHQGDSGSFNTLAGKYNSNVAFSSFEDKEGIGIEAPLKYRDIVLTINAEQLKAEPNNSQRLGAGLDYTLGKATFGIAQDQLEIAGTNKNQNLVKIIWDEKTDQFGAALIDKEGARSADAFWCHYGKDEAWGTRTYAKYDWNNKNSDNCLTLDSIIAQNPTFSKVSSPWIVSRDSTAGAMYNQGLVENPFAGERIPVNNRSKKGAVTEIKYIASEKAQVLDRTLRIDSGYTFPSIGKFKPGFLAIYSHNLDKEEKDFAGASAIATYTTSSASVCLEATHTRNLETDKPETYFSLSCSKSF